MKHKLRHKTVIIPLYKAAVGAAFSILQRGSPFEQPHLDKNLFIDREKNPSYKYENISLELRKL